MSLLRFAGRVLFSAYFIADGFQLLTKPDQNTDEVAPTVDRVVPAVQSLLPPDVADRVPEDARTWTRLLGLAQIAGGVAYATGIARRPAALVLAKASLIRVIGAGASDDRSGLLNHLALFGAAVVATQDTAGRPSLAWRAEQSRKALEQRAEAASKAAGKAAGQGVKRTRKTIERQAEHATKTAGHNLKLARVHLEKAGTEAELAAEKARRKFKDVLR